MTNADHVIQKIMSGKRSFGRRQGTELSKAGEAVLEMYRQGDGGGDSISESKLWGKVIRQALDDAVSKPKEDDLEGQKNKRLAILFLERPGMRAFLALRGVPRGNWKSVGYRKSWVLKGRREGQQRLALVLNRRSRRTKKK